jgi:hypothetical protein
MSPWAVAPGGCKPGVKKLALKGTGEARCKPPRGRAWLRKHMMSKRSDKRPTRNRVPASIPCTMGQRPHPMVVVFPKDGRDWICVCASPKDVRGQPELPSNRSGFREERIGSWISHHLRASVEYVVVNVGGPGGEGSSPPVKRVGVGGVIVLGGWENHLHGEGRQLVGISTQNSRMLTGMKFP